MVLILVRELILTSVGPDTPEAVGRRALLPNWPCFLDPIKAKI